MVKNITRSRIAFLDRDGVINKQLTENEKPCSPKHFSEIEILSGVFEAITILKEENFVVRAIRSFCI